jgi:hypothetical protein
MSDQSTEPLFHCEKCNYSTNHKYNYINHCKSKKHNDEERKPRSKSNKNTTCEICNITFRDTYRLKRHLETNQHKAKNEETLLKTIEDQKNKIERLESIILLQAEKLKVPPIISDPGIELN